MEDHKKDASTRLRGGGAVFNLTYSYVSLDSLPRIDTNPSEIMYDFGAGCGGACGHQDEGCSAAEVGSYCLLLSTTQYFASHGNNLESLFGDIDILRLFTEEDLNSNALREGVGGHSVRRQCGRGVACWSASNAFNGVHVAHEIGHNFKMGHDVTNDGSSIMESNIHPTIPVAFSAQSEHLSLTFSKMTMALHSPLAQRLMRGWTRGWVRYVETARSTRVSNVTPPTASSSDPCCDSDCATSLHASVQNKTRAAKQALAPAQFIRVPPVSG